MAKMTVLSVALTPQQKELWTKFSEAQGPRAIVNGQAAH
jgi:hypothetical protein